MYSQTGLDFTKNNTKIDYDVFEDQCYVYDGDKIDLRRQLWYACKNGHAEMAKLLIKTQYHYGDGENGVNQLVNTQTKKGNTFLKMAIKSGKSSVAEVMVEAGATFDKCKYTFDKESGIPVFEDKDIDSFYQIYFLKIENTVHECLGKQIPEIDIIDKITRMAIIPNLE